MRKTIRRAVPRTKIEPISAGSTVGKMKLYRKVVKEETVSMDCIIGVGRFESPKRINRRFV